MGISFLFVLGLFGVLLLWLCSHSIIEVIRKKNKLVGLLRSKKLFQHYGSTGIYLFFTNAFLFFFTMLVLYGLQWLGIPFLHLLVMLVAVGLSLFLWIIIHLAWQGAARDRWKMGGIGSSFYFLLTGFFAYQFVTIEPMFPGDDPFMKSLGFMVGMIVAFVAFVTCFFLTAFERGKSY
jgi:hypothetical protein